MTKLRTKVISAVQSKFPQMQIAQHDFVPHVSLASMKANIKLDKHFYFPAQIVAFLTNPATAPEFMRSKIKAKTQTAKASDMQTLQTKPPLLAVAPIIIKSTVSVRKGAPIAPAKADGEKQTTEIANPHSAAAPIAHCSAAAPAKKSASVWTADHDTILKSLNALKTETNSDTLSELLQDLYAALITPRRGFKIDAKNKDGKTLGDVINEIDTQ